MENLQPFEVYNREIKDAFLSARRQDPNHFLRKIDLAWSVWMFGTEGLAASAKRLSANGIRYVEMKGDHQTRDLGTAAVYAREVLAGNGLQASGTCGMFGSENDLSSNSAYVRQHAIDYVRSEVEFLAELGGSYLIVVPSAVGRPVPIDNGEFVRSARSLAACGDDFAAAGIAAAVEPIRSAEVSLIHTVKEAVSYIEAVGHSAIGHINADIYHMSLEETHIGQAILSCGDRLKNLHLADTNRDGLGRGMMDLDTVIMAAYLTGMNQEGRFLTPEPLGPYPDPYVLANSPCKTEIMDSLVKESVRHFREREEYVRTLET